MDMIPMLLATLLALGIIGMSAWYLSGKYFYIAPLGVFLFGALAWALGKRPIDSPEYLATLLAIGICAYAILICVVDRTSHLYRKLNAHGWRRFPSERVTTRGFKVLPRTRCFIPRHQPRTYRRE